MNESDEKKREIRLIQDAIAEAFPPFEPGSYVTYRNENYLLCGGPDDPTNGLVQDCKLESGQWIFHLSNGLRLRSPQIVSVAIMDAVTGMPVSAWVVANHGLNGQGKRFLPMMINSIST